ncbi:uncharacterized protein LOC107371908 [Tetranychus urticae]|nr:uncharacterized protein LOC107371908 [Tetranychus urticae]
MATAKGLLNMPGQNNCFLNSAIQVLWHLDIFRRSFRELSGHACMGSESCIFCALKELFTQFQYSQESALPPDSLRKALAETFSDQRRFQLGFMDDAAECFENILLRIHDHIAHDEPEDGCRAPHCISHEKFAMNLVEQVSCSSCGYTSEPHPFTQLVNYVSSPALCVQAKKLATCPPVNPRLSTFGSLLRSGEAYGNIRDCPSGCGSKIQIRKTLVNQPDIVSVGLVWDSERPSLNQITQIFSIIETQLNLEDVFDGFGPINKSRSAVSVSTGLGGCLPLQQQQQLSASSSILELVGLVTYYGKHYSTFFYHTSLSCWIYFDDAAVREIGPHWDQVVDKCIKGHFQPLLLLYANPHGNAINAATAPQSIIRVANPPGNKSMVNRSNGYHPHLLHRSNPMSHKLPNIMPLSSSYSTYLGSGSTNFPSRPNRPLSLLSLPNQPIRQNVPSLTTASSSTSLHSYQRSHGGGNIYGTMRLPPKRNNIATRPGSMDDLLNHYGSASDDVPDSPLTRSSFSSTCFSDACDTDSGYISRKTVESILSMQKQAKNQQPVDVDSLYSSYKGQQRNSVSSIDSYSTELSLPKRSYEDKFLLSAKACSLQRRDSGNSSNGSGDRMSASSISSITSREDNPYLFNQFVRSKTTASGRFLQPAPPSQSSSSSTSSTSSSSGDHSRLHKKSASTIDQGYDSFSLSSSDSYPSMGQTTPTKQSSGYFTGNSRLTQIPEDVQLMGLMASNGSALQDCDQLCSQSDVLMMKSIEKEREGDLIAAAVLSDSAAHKARFAMAAPYSNPQMLVSAKMKHSICVMRSANLHKRIKEKEAEEKRRAKMESIGEVSGHSRQGSRDSLHSRHSRQNSRDGSVKEMKKENKENARKSLIINSNTSNNNVNSNNVNNINNSNYVNINSISNVNSNNSGGNFTGNRKTIQLYATLPKKSCKKKLTITNPIPINDEPRQSSNNPPSLPEKSISVNQMIKRSDKSSDIKSDAESSLSSMGSIMRIARPRPKESLKTLSVYSMKDSDLSDNYYSEWEAVKGTSREPLKRSFSGSTTGIGNGIPLTPPSKSLLSSSASVKSVDTDIYSETSIGDLTSESSSNKKHKIRRKLLIGSFMKRKNRSLPDLRENIKPDSDRASEADAVKKSSGDDSTISQPKTVAKVSKKGFHQGMGIYQRPCLLKVNPPLLETSKLDVSSSSSSLKSPITANNPIKLTLAHQQNRGETQGNQLLSSNVNQIQKHLIPRPPTPPRPKCSEEMSSGGLSIKANTGANNVTIKSINNTITKPILKSPSPLPPPPPVDEVDCCMIKPGSPSQGIEPNEDLPPPPESFLQELREKRNEMSSESLLARLTSERLASSRDSIVSFSETSSIRVPPESVQSSVNPPSQPRSDYDCVDSSSLTISKTKSDSLSSNLIKPSSIRSSGSPSVKDLASRFQKLSTLPLTSSTSLKPGPTSTNNNNCNNSAIINNNNTTNQRNSSSLSSTSSVSYKANSNSDKFSCSSSLSSSSQSQAAQSTISSSTPTTVSPSPQPSQTTVSPNNTLTSPSSLRQGLRVVTLLGSTMRNNLESQSQISSNNNNSQKLSQLSTTNNASTDIHGSSRPDRPPDYQTAIKRLSLMKDFKRLSTSPSPSTVLPTVNGNNSLSDHNLSASPATVTNCSPALLINSKVTPLIRPTPINPAPITSAGRIAHSPSHLQAPSPSPSTSSTVMSTVTESQSLNCSNHKINPIKVDEIANRRKDTTPKKSVSFSDQVVLVAPAEDDDEEYLPNPLLQRVLGGGKAIAQPSPA